MDTPEAIGLPSIFGRNRRNPGVSIRRVPGVWAQFPPLAAHGSPSWTGARVGFPCVLELPLPLWFNALP